MYISFFLCSLFKIVNSYTVRYTGVILPIVDSPIWIYTRYGCNMVGGMVTWCWMVDIQKIKVLEWFVMASRV